MTEKIEVTESSGNVFADLGFPDAEETLARTDVILCMFEIIAERELTQNRPAAIVGTDQPNEEQIQPPSPPTA